MISLLIHLFVRDWRKPEEPRVRLSYGMLSGGVGTAVNLLLFVLKLIIGIVSGSIAIAADAANNLSDSGSSIIALCGFYFGSKPADAKHPFGHGRLEYVGALIVSVIIITVGASFLKDSLMRVFHPSAVVITTLALGIYGGSMLLKIWLFFFYRRIGREIHSEIIAAQAFDSLSDLLTTSVVLIAVFATRFTDFPIDGIAGFIVAVFVLWGGIALLKNTISPLLGECPDPTIVTRLSECLMGIPGIKGVHDIIIHNYGPGRYFASAHAEIAQNCSIMAAHDLMEHAESVVMQKLPIMLLLHCDPFDVHDPEVISFRSDLENVVSQYDPLFRVSDFRLLKNGPPGQPELYVLDFDLTIPNTYQKSQDQIAADLTGRMQQTPHNLLHLPVTLKIDFKTAFV